ncbi:hypothetical protein GCM10028813_31990 [Ramlibacter alkalitolerans]
MRGRRCTGWRWTSAWLSRWFLPPPPGEGRGGGARALAPELRRGEAALTPALSRKRERRGEWERPHPALPRRGREKDKRG